MASRGSFEMLTYGDLGREAWGPLGEILANLVINIFLFGIYSAYAVLIGMQLENISQQGLEKRVWILSSTGLCGPGADSEPLRSLKARARGYAGRLRHGGLHR